MTSPIHIIRSFDAPAARVFDAWVAPQTLIGPVTAVEMDPVVGGAVVVRVGSDPVADLHGRFLTVERPHRLRYTWRWGRSAEETLIDVGFVEAGTSTTVVLEHRGFIDEASRATHLDGWVAYVDGLAGYL